MCICMSLCVFVYCPAFIYLYTALWQTMQNKQQPETRERQTVSDLKKGTERKKLTAYLLRNTNNSLSGFALNMFTFIII